MKLFVEQRHYFPDPQVANYEGLVAVSDELSVEVLLEAYSFGIFPWPQDDSPILWFCPSERGVLDFNELHIPRSLRKEQRRASCEITFNRCFDDVIDACAGVPRAGQAGTWITAPMIKAYKEFHRAGYAHSVECWSNGELTGGLYGVYVAGVFSGESMFYRHSHASKFCLLHLIEKLQAEGLTWMDIQMVTDNLQVFGGKYVSRAAYLKRLAQAKKQARPIKF